MLHFFMPTMLWKTSTESVLQHTPPAAAVTPTIHRSACRGPPRYHHQRGLDYAQPRRPYRLSAEQYFNPWDHRAPPSPCLRSPLWPKPALPPEILTSAENVAASGRVTQGLALQRGTFHPLPGARHALQINMKCDALGTSRACDAASSGDHERQLRYCRLQKTLPPVHGNSVQRVIESRTAPGFLFRYPGVAAKPTLFLSVVLAF